ncbi:MAG: DUF357 domain-containing protein [Candidatus Micrarchaeales archaeon]|jgi:hypothetical protein
MEIEERIMLDIGKFDESISRLKSKKIAEKERSVVELAEMYAKDAEAWLKKKDFYTAFASISYAHGLLDAIIKLNK